MSKAEDRADEELTHLRALIAEALAVLEPYIGAFNAAEERYRQRGGNPESVNQNAPWFEIAPTLLVGGRPRVAPELRVLASPAQRRTAPPVLLRRG